MNKVLNIATQCNTRLKLKALKTICTTLIVLTMLVSFVIAITLNVIVDCSEASVKIHSGLIAIYLDLNR